MVLANNVNNVPFIEVQIDKTIYCSSFQINIECRVAWSIFLRDTLYRAGLFE